MMTTRRGLLLQLAAGTTAFAQSTGSLDPLIESLAVTDPKLSWLQPRFRNLRSWKKQAQARYLELLHYRPAAVDPKAQVLSTETRDGLTIERLTFATTPNIRVPAYVLKPASAKGKLPAVIALHDHGGFYMWGKEKLLRSVTGPENPVLTAFKQRYYSGRNIAEDLAHDGYLVIAIDMFYWGERRMLMPADPAGWRERPADMPKERIDAFNARCSANEQLVGRSVMSTGATWAGIMTWDDVRTVDYLISRPDVDPKRIACTGLSVGAVRAAYLAAADERIKVAMPICWMTSFPDQLRDKVGNTIGHTKLIPGLYGDLDYPDLASLAMPAALLVINGGKDGLFAPSGVAKAHEKLRACYRKAGIADRVECTMYPDAPHEFNAEMQKQAWAFLRKWI